MVVFGITSVKRNPIKQILISAPLGVELVSIHPLFGPSMPDMEEQTTIVERDERGRHVRSRGRFSRGPVDRREVPKRSHARC